MPTNDNTLFGSDTHPMDTDTDIDVEESIHHEEDDYEANLLDILSELEPPETDTGSHQYVLPSIVEELATSMFDSLKDAEPVTHEECLHIILDMYNRGLLTNNPIQGYPTNETTNIEDFNETDEPLNEYDDEYTPTLLPKVDNELVWDMSNVIDENHNFFSRRRLHSHPPEFIINDGEGYAKFILTPRTTRDLATAFSALDKIYRGESPVEEERLTGFKGTKQRAVTWWRKRKIVGSIVGVLVLAFTMLSLYGFIKVSF